MEVYDVLFASRVYVWTARSEFRRRVAFNVVACLSDSCLMSGVFHASIRTGCLLMLQFISDKQVQPLDRSLWPLVCYLNVHEVRDIAASLSSKVRLSSSVWAILSKNGGWIRCLNTTWLSIDAIIYLRQTGLTFGSKSLIAYCTQCIAGLTAVVVMCRS